MATSGSVIYYEIVLAEERALDAAKFVEAAARVPNPELLDKCRKAVAERDYAAVISEILDVGQGVLFRNSSDEDVEAIFTIIFSFLGNVQPERYARVVVRIRDAIQSAGDGGRAPVRLRLLVTLFNVVDERVAKAEKVALFSHLVSFASDSKQLELLSPYFASAGTWQSKWGISDTEARGLYLAVSRALDKAGDVDGAQVFLIRYLTTFEGAAAADIDDDAKARARDAAVGFIKAPAVSQRSSLPQLAAVRALASDPRYASLSSLVSVFAHGSLADFEAFVAKEPALIADIGLDYETSVDTMRLLTLLSLASTSLAAPAPNHGALAYATVADALKVPAADVEAWVVRCIARGLIDARMDQSTATVTVTRAVIRDFGPQQWAGLALKLRTWRDNVANLLACIESGRS